MKKKNSYSFKQFFNSRFSLYAMLIVITISFICTYSKVYDVKLDLNGDNIHYYALGKALTEGKGFTNIMSFKETPHTHFPPGYPVFVAGVMKFFPNNINAVKIANGLLLFASILLLFFLLKKLSGSIIIPFLTCIFCSMHAEILRYATIMMSEIAFSFLQYLHYLSYSHDSSRTIVYETRLSRYFAFAAPVIFEQLHLFCQNDGHFPHPGGYPIHRNPLLQANHTVLSRKEAKA